MRPTARHLLVAAALAPVGCGLLNRGGSERTPPTTATANLVDRNGRNVGTATLTSTSQGVLLSASFTGLGPGTHGIHVHETGLCTPNFDAAGAHFNPGNRQHGFRNPAGAHAGDMPNIHVSPSGALTTEFLLPGVQLAGARAILDENGAAVVVHANADDYTTDPAGNSGERVACGVLAGH